jgi:hypothetical protein
VLRDRTGGEGIEWLFLQETLARHLEKSSAARGRVEHHQ